MWRGWVAVWPYDRILSASSSDGLTWRPDHGVRLDVAGRNGNHSGGTYFPFVMRCSDGLWRMYFRGSDVDRILSATSQDGLSWSLERGFRIDVGGDPPLRRVSCPRVVAGSDSLRMFFTAMRAGADGFSIYSAVSKDGLSWSRESGVRLQPQGADPSRSLYSFCLAPRASEREELRLYYERFSPIGSCICLATSVDGLRWMDQGPVLEPVPGEFGVRSPWIFPTGERTGLRMYFVAGSRYRSLGTSIYSAMSGDGIAWTREPGVRVRRGGRYSADGLISPCVVGTPEGRLRMYYGGYWGPHVLGPLTRHRHRVA